MANASKGQKPQSRGQLDVDLGNNKGGEFDTDQNPPQNKERIAKFMGLYMAQSNSNHQWATN